MEAWRLRGGLQGFSPKQGSAVFCGADHRRLLLGLDRVQQRFVEQDLEAPSVGVRRGTLRRDQVRCAVLTWKPGHYFYELLFWQTLALVFSTVYGCFWKKSCGFLRDGGHGS